MGGSTSVLCWRAGGGPGSRAEAGVSTSQQGQTVRNHDLRGLVWDNAGGASAGWLGRCTDDWLAGNAASWWCNWGALIDWWWWWDSLGGLWWWSWLGGLLDWWWSWRGVDGLSGAWLDSLAGHWLGWWWVDIWSLGWWWWSNRGRRDNSGGRVVDWWSSVLLALWADGGGDWDLNGDLLAWAVGDLRTAAGDGQDLGVVDGLSERDGGDNANKGGDNSGTHYC